MNTHTRTARTHTLGVRPGMTLMELVVGLTITAAMAGMGMAAFGGIIDERRAIRESTVAMERAAALRDQLRTWIGQGTILITTSAIPQTGGRNSITPTVITAPSSSGSNSTVLQPAITAAAATGDEISFNTTAPNPLDAASIRIRLFIDGDAATPEKGLTIEYQANQQSPLARRQVDSTISKLTVEFLDSLTNRWVGTSEAASITPKAVRITLGHDDSSADIPPILKVPLIFKMGS